MKSEIIEEIQQLNPWLADPSRANIDLTHYLPRNQQEDLLDPEWDSYWMLLIGPRRAGKTTLGHYLSYELRQQQRFQDLLYLNFDLALLRMELNSPVFLDKLLKILDLKKPIVFLDEVQRLPSPGLLLKSIADLNWPIKMIASGSSQLEIKSKVQEHLTGREIESLVLPLSSTEMPSSYSLETQLIYGSYPQIVLSNKKQRLIGELYRRYIEKDIIEILQVGKPLVLEKLITLVAHCSGQLINYQQLATDCRVSTPTIQNYLDLLEKTYILAKVRPFVGNKRSEITSNPIYYFIDNGFRNQALRNFHDLERRLDAGLLAESYVFQELFKFQHQLHQSFDLFFWRTKAGAEVDFVLHKNSEQLIPVEVKFRMMNRSQITKSFRSFLQAYKPKQAIIITKSWFDEIEIENCRIHFIPITHMQAALKIITDYFL